MPVKPIPEGYHSITPYLVVKGGARAIEFYKRAFGATETLRLDGPDGSVMHAELKIGDSHVMLADENADWGVKGPEGYGGTPVSLMLYVEDADAVAAQAVAAGAKVERPVEDQFYGDRTGTVVDPFGHKWSIGTHKEDVSAEEMQRRALDMMKPQT